jgi:CIC family chloride channel protein
MGAGIASVLGRAAKLTTDKVKALVPVGVAAALAAAFNSPIGAVLFSLEEVMGNLHAPVLGSVVLSSATAWMVLRLSLGNEPLFHVPPYRLVHPVEFALYAILGVLGGLVSVAFVRMLLWMRAYFLRMPKRTVWAQPLAGGVMVGLCGWAVPQVLGVGYGFVGDALNGRMALQLMAVLVLLKVLATATCSASGNSGGIFGPSLFIGAMLGGTMGSVAHSLLPAHTAVPGAYALVGMGAAFAGIIRVPMTSVIMIFEITHDYAIIVPLMIANLVSFLVSSRLQRTPIYEALALQDGIHLPSAETRKREEGFCVDRAMRPCGEMLSPELTVAGALERVRRSGEKARLVADQYGLRGVVSTAMLEQAITAGAGAQKLADFLGRHPPHLHADHSLALALQRMGSTGLDLLPVVSRGNPRHVVGVVTLAAVLDILGLGKGLTAGPTPPPPTERVDQ